MLKKYLFNNFNSMYKFSQRKVIDPEAFTTEKVEDYFFVKSRTYEFLIAKLPDQH